MQPTLCAEYNGTVGGTWYPPTAERPGYHFEPPCELIRPTVHAVRSCLADRHLLFFGDSLQRYMYLTLANFIVSGEWPEDSKIRSPWYENTYFAESLPEDEKWLRYFEDTNAQLTGHEVCDCWREDCCQESHLHENRYMRVGNAAVSFVSQMVGPDWAPHGSVAPGSWEAMRAGIMCAPGRCNVSNADGHRTPRWRTSITNFMRATLPKLGVTDVLLNLGGHHWSVQHRTPLVEQIFDAAQHGASRRVWVRTTTPRHKGDLSATSRMGFALREEAVTMAAARRGLGILDMMGIMMALKGVRDKREKEGAFVDGVHLQCSVNRELLIVLLNQLCDPELLRLRRGEGRGAAARTKT